jgi:hypothetical protein
MKLKQEIHKLLTLHKQNKYVCIYIYIYILHNCIAHISTRVLRHPLQDPESVEKTFLQHTEMLQLMLQLSQNNINFTCFNQVH